MGQAKQRKKLMGDRYGKDFNPWERCNKEITPEQRQEWLSEMYECLPGNCKPDMGHIQFASTGYLKINLALMGTLLFAPDITGAMITSTSGASCLSLIVKKGSKLFNLIRQFIVGGSGSVVLNGFPLPLIAKPCPSERYIASNGEWVLPYLADVDPAKEYPPISIKKMEDFGQNNFLDLSHSFVYTKES